MNRVRGHSLAWLAAVPVVTLALASAVHADATGDIAESRDSAIVRAIERASPAVVNIHATQTRQVYGWFWNLWESGRFPERQYQSLGSGCVFDARNRYVLTNQHVIEDADEIHVGLQDGRVFEADVVGADAFSDLAVLRIDGTDLPEAELGVSEDLRIGEWAIAIGNPFGQLVRDRKPTVTVGVVSAANRVVVVGGRMYSDLLQTDASVNPGNSGGPLVNAAGDVIGINTFIFTESGGSHGVNFAIAIDTAKKVVDHLVRDGKVAEPWVGLTYSRLGGGSRNSPSGTPDGVVLTYVEEKSPAAAARLVAGDIVLGVNGRHVYGVRDTRAAIRLMRPGERIDIEFTRDSKRRRATVVAAEPRDTYSFFGAHVKAGSQPGVVAVEQLSKGSVFDRVLQPGDRIVGIGPPGIRHLRELQLRFEYVEDVREGSLRIRPSVRLSLVFERHGTMYPYEFMVS